MLTIHLDVNGRVQVGDVSVNISKNLDYSATIPWEGLRFGLDQNMNFTVGGGFNVFIASASVTTNPSQLLFNADPNLRASVSVGPARGTLTIDAGPGFYNIGAGILRDVYNALYAMSVSPFPL